MEVVAQGKVKGSSSILNICLSFIDIVSWGFLFQFVFYFSFSFSFQFLKMFNFPSMSYILFDNTSV